MIEKSGTAAEGLRAGSPQCDPAPIRLAGDTPNAFVSDRK
jgi:hypothetical protein